MADVRALVAAERASRRITHPHLTYTKAGVLLCNVCSLNVKSEALWDGHLKSANHRKNAAAAAAKAAAANTTSELNAKGTKRKLEDVDYDERQDDSYGSESEGRKKARSRAASLHARFDDGSSNGGGVGDDQGKPPAVEALPQIDEQQQQQQPLPQPSPLPVDSQPTTTTTSPQEWQSTPLDISTPSGPPAPPPTGPAAEIDEDEWAAFESEIAPLAQEAAAARPDYAAAATISAAPVSAAQVEAAAVAAAAAAEQDRPRGADAEAEEEKEEQERRLEEEFELLEEMEEKVRRLREKREALKTGQGKAAADTGQEGEAVQVVEFGDVVGAQNLPDGDAEKNGTEKHAGVDAKGDHNDQVNDNDDDDDDDDDEDAWYR